MADNTAVLDNGANALVTPSDAGIKQYSDFVMDGNEAAEETQSNVADTNKEETSAGETTETTQSEGEESKGDPLKPKRPGGLTRKLLKAENENAQLRAELDKLKQPTSQAPAPNNGEPRLDQFKDYESYMRALIRWENQQEHLKRQGEEQLKTFRQRQQETRQRYADYDEVINDYDGPISPALSQAVVESDLGGELQYYLGQNPDLIDRLNTMSPIQVGKEIAKLERQIEAKLNPLKAEAPAAKVTKAPPPVAPVGSAKTATTVSPDDMDYEQYKEWRRKQR